MNYHIKESIRIKKELDDLCDDFAEFGPVKTILRSRIAQEHKRGT